MQKRGTMSDQDLGLPLGKQLQSGKSFSFHSIICKIESKAVHIGRRKKGDLAGARKELNIILDSLGLNRIGS